ncbi:hypothetical protein OEZ86_013037 [Tetradesmus obliquus]|nr:hypothetical protein OEZ86_013037 [Tetradesmus obliquus]
MVKNFKTERRILELKITSSLKLLLLAGAAATRSSCSALDIRVDPSGSPATWACEGPSGLVFCFNQR